jgi:MurNAc alpha-1-phosphate uridylyltransferase
MIPKSRFRLSDKIMRENKNLERDADSVGNHRALENAMVLAAGLGTRMRPLTDSVPKPLVRLAGRPLIDHVLDRLAEAGIKRACVNVHYLAGQIVRHLQDRPASPLIVISDEQARLLDTGGGVKRALQEAGGNAILVHNSDSVWAEAGAQNLVALIEAWEPDAMDGLLLLAVKETSIGYGGRGDFSLDASGRLARRAREGAAPYVFTGVSILSSKAFEAVSHEIFSLNLIFDKAIEDKRLFGIVLDGIWMHVGSEQALIEAEGRLRTLESRRPYAST